MQIRALDDNGSSRPAALFAHGPWQTSPVGPPCWGVAADTEAPVAIDLSSDPVEVAVVDELLVVSVDTEPGDEVVGAVQLVSCVVDSLPEPSVTVMGGTRFGKPVGYTIPLTVTGDTLVCFVLVVEVDGLNTPGVLDCSYVSARFVE